MPEAKYLANNVILRCTDPGVASVSIFKHVLKKLVLFTNYWKCWLVCSLAAIKVSKSPAFPPEDFCQAFACYTCVKHH